MPLLLLICIGLALCLVLVLWNSTQRYYRPTNFPPGPWQLPVVGNLLQFRISPLKAMSKWHNKYGKIVGLRLGSYRYVMINDYDLLKEAFTQNAFNGRPQYKPALLFSGGVEHGTVVSAGDSWDQIRRFTIKNLNVLGFGKKSMESCIMRNVKNIVHALEDGETGQPIQLRDKFVITATNSIWKILVGKYISMQDHHYFRKCLASFHKIFWLPIGSVAWQLPWLVSIFPIMTGYNKQKIVAQKLHNLIDQEVKAHLSKRRMEDALSKTRDDIQTNDSKDLMSAFLNQIEKADAGMGTDKLGEQSGFWHSNMNGMIFNLFITSAEAITNITNWAIMYLSLHPEIQNKMWNEIQDVIGEKTPSLDDQAQMPYTQAVMKEVFRLSSTSPFSNFQQTTQDVPSFHGYYIPKDTIIIGNLFGIHHDKKLYPNPGGFTPERFLQGQNCSTAPLMPFGVGLRSCPGQAYTKIMFFLLITTLLQNFEFKWDPARRKLTPQEIIEQSRVSIFRFCPDYKVVLKKRNAL